MSARSEVDLLREESHLLREQVALMKDIKDGLLRLMSEAAPEIEKMRKALEWYADDRHWDDEGRCGQYEQCFTEDMDPYTDFELDRGERAREALEQK